MKPEIEKLVQMAIVDGQVTAKEREIILRKAEKLGLDVDEVEMYLESFINSNKSNTNSEINQEVPENREIKTPKKDVYKAREFNPKTVKHIEPALLDKESELKFNIEELNTSKTVLLEELENLYKNIKTYQDYLESQKIVVQNQLGVLKSEFSITSKIYLDKFINEINLSVSEKFGNTALIFNNPEKLIEIDSNKIVALIKNHGEWDISKLNGLRAVKGCSLAFIPVFISIILTIIYNNIDDFDDRTSYSLPLFITWVISFTIGLKVGNNFSDLIKKNKMNFSDEDLNPIVNEILFNYKNECEELVSLKNDINNLEKLNSKLELKKITEFNRK